MRKQNIKISVVIPVYNAEKFLSKCMEHLIHQTFQNLEIIVVDDGSTDNTASVYKNYANRDNRVLILKQKNAGPSAASNAGLSVATGDYIHFHDHDDFVNLDYFEKMAYAANLTDADVLCGEVNQPRYNFPLFKSIEVCTTLKDKITKTRANNYNPAWRYVYKTEFLKEKGLVFEEAVFGAQDFLFTQKAIILANTVTLVPGAVYNVVNTDTALGKNKRKPKDPDAHNAAMQRHIRFIAEHDATNLMCKKIVPYEIHSLKMFNLEIFRTEIYGKKNKYYVFGKINIGTKHFN